MDEQKSKYDELIGELCLEVVTQDVTMNSIMAVRLSRKIIDWHNKKLFIHLMTLSNDIVDLKNYDTLMEDDDLFSEYMKKRIKRAITEYINQTNITAC